MIWKIYEPNTRLQKVLGDALGVSPLFAQLLLNRGIKTPEQGHHFLFGGLDDCADPFLMKDMEKASLRIKSAIDKKEKVLIYGDYDVDGVTSIALLADILEHLDADYQTFIPNRVEEGYGLNMDAITWAGTSGVDLIVTVDCGIDSVEEVEYAGSRGIDVIVTDHHVPKLSRRPPAYAVVDPHQADCAYPYKDLAGVGIAYKLAQALTKGGENVADRHLDLVALGTIADVAPLTGENRILVKSGMEQLKRTEKPGLKALMDVAGIEAERLTCRSVGFALGPRINAMGRINSADTALKLLMCMENSEAREIAAVLDRENRNRQSIQKGILKGALERVENDIDLSGRKVIVLADDQWHPGVIGIVASRLTEEYNKPTILIALEGKTGRGSGRSVEGFNLFEAINKAGEHLLGFGGHKGACGIEIEREKVQLFTERLNAVAGECFKENAELLPELKVDLQLPFSHISVRLINEIDKLMPYGSENEEPVFTTSGITVKNVPRDIGASGFKFLATCGSLTTCEAITFRKNHVARPKRGDAIDLAYTPSINSWRGIDSIQLNIKDLRIC